MSKKKLTYEINWAENLEFMSTLSSESINFIYIDPPFNTSKIQKRKKKTIPKDWAKYVVDLQYYDSFGNGTSGYLQFMKPRLEHCHRLLKSGGVLCVHLDYRAVHYIKCMLDEIFGYGDIDIGKDEHFINEIVWCFTSPFCGKKHFPRHHNSILCYSKDKFKTSDDYTFNFNDLKTDYKKLETGTSKTGIYKKSKTLSEDGKILESYWLEEKGNGLSPVGRRPSEDLKYPSQKPVALVERLVKAFTKEGDLVADFFCGCATTLEASMNLSRSFIGCDGQEKVLNVLKERILKRPNMRKHKIKPCSPFSQIPKNFNEMNWKDYERKSILCVGGVPNAVQTSDGGWDGIRISDGALIQAKKHNSKTGRPDLQKFVGAMVLRGKKKGVFISHYGYSKEARDFVSDIRKDGYIIELKTSHYLQKEAELKQKEFQDFNTKIKSS